MQQPISALDRTEYQAEQAEFSTPETFRNAPLHLSSADEFQRIAACLDGWPTDLPMDAFSLKLMTAQCREDAQTAWLRDLASW